MSELLDVFNEEPVESEASNDEVEQGESTSPEVEQEPESEVSQEDAEDKQGEPEKPESEESDDRDFDSLPEWAKAEIKNKRRKSQDKDSELEQLRKELEELKGGNQDKVERPDVFDDQDGYAKSIAEEARREVANAKLEMSRELMMSSKDDYEEIEQYVLDVAKEDPAFANYVRSEASKQSNPAKFIYEQGRKHKEFKEMQDTDAYKNKLKAELMAELKAEQEKAAKEKESKSANLSPSLATARGAGADKEASIPENPGDLFN